MPQLKPEFLVKLEDFQRLDEMNPGDSITWMIYGPAKSGKTWFMGTAGDRTLFLNTGAGAATLQSPLFKQRIKANPIVITIEEKVGSNGLPVSNAQAFDMMTDAIDFAIAEMGDKFDTICVDDSTAVRRYIMYKALEFNQATKKSKTLDQVKQWEIGDAAVQDYKTEMAVVMQFLIGTIDVCKKNKKHLIIGAHERHTFKKGDKIGDEATVIRIRPGFTGQTMPDEVGGLFDILTHSEAVGGSSNVIYRQRFAGDEILQAGCRFAGIFETVESDVNFLKCVERIKAAQLNPKAAFKR